SAAQPRARTTGYERDLFAMANAHDRLYLFGGSGQQHGQGQHPEHGEAVALVRAELLGLGDQARRAHDGAKFFEDAGVHMLLSSHGEPSAERGLNSSPERNQAT